MRIFLERVHVYSDRGSSWVDDFCGLESFCGYKPQPVCHVSVCNCWTVLDNYDPFSFDQARLVDGYLRGGSYHKRAWCELFEIRLYELHVHRLCGVHLVYDSRIRESYVDLAGVVVQFVSGS